MTLQPQKDTFHNRMLGKKIQHPPSTNYDEDFEIPNAKRLKRLDNSDSPQSRREQSATEDESEPLFPNLEPCSRPRREVPDSEAESDDDFPQGQSSQTELESALPSVKSDKEAIAEYEAARAAESESLDLQGRLGQRKWVQGKSSIYVDAFNLALETVLEDESHLFDEAEMDVFEQWRQLSYEGQYL